ncbi:AraC family transcriptional regulator [Saccharomonospora sp. NPDC046836]|uniref:helix-turn-helix domain-containing protein n=1 Tax=Saccharomonospora sp. NPDC046836 TaxID=3156921 RepID=UPI0033DBF39A
MAKLWKGREPQAIDSRALPVFAAGTVEVPFVISGPGELVSRDTAWEAHAHPTHELLWNRRGASNATIGTRTWTITPVIGLWLPAGVVHVGYAPAGTWYRTAHFDTEAVPGLSDEPVAVEITPLLSLLLDRLAEDSLGVASRALTEQLVLDVLTPSSHALLVQMPTSELLHPIAEAFEADPGDTRSLPAWAGRLGVSERTIARAFRTETGLSFTGWQAAVRAQRAVLLLASGMRVEEVAERLGYGSASAFGAAFRRTTGLTPGQFRNASTAAG